MRMQSFKQSFEFNSSINSFPLEKFALLVVEEYLVHTNTLHGIAKKMPLLIVFIQALEFKTYLISFSQPDALKQLIALYVGRCFACWKLPEVMEWLERNVKSVIDQVEKKCPLIETYKQR
jgi:hypothetical protein